MINKKLWAKVENHLLKVRCEYLKCGCLGKQECHKNIDPLLFRLFNGERTTRLYKEVMGLD